MVYKFGFNGKYPGVDDVFLASFNIVRVDFEEIVAIFAPGGPACMKLMRWDCTALYTE